MTKYCNQISDGKDGSIDGKTALQLRDDAARANWGGGWRMPTRAEFEELLNHSNCTWTWTTRNGVEGCMVVSKKPGYEGNSIFLPAAGYRDNTYLYFAGLYGDYWSSSLGADDSGDAWFLGFNSGHRDTNNYYRSIGHSIRPVCP